jgi:hypothetical protein
MPGSHHIGHADMTRTGMPEKPPNDLRISCGRSSRRPHKPTFRFVLKGRSARAELGTPPARRLHARVRRRAARDARYQEAAVAWDHTTCHCDPCRS